MATFTVWKFDSAEGADDALATLKALQGQEPIRVDDAAIVRWSAIRTSPQTWELHDLAGPGTLGSAFWGFLFGLIFLVPLLGTAAVATGGALGDSLGDAGIDDAFLSAVRETVTPGTSALFLIASDAAQDTVLDAFAHSQATVIRATLSARQEQALHRAFAEAQ
jgi:uncharacterized membrane protein